MWKLELEENYFRIFDSKRNIAGYFDPYYGEIFPKENEQEIIEKMHKNHDKISGGNLMVPMVKFGIFIHDNAIDITLLEHQLSLAENRISQWKNFLNKIENQNHEIYLSHTDQDMLSITFQIKFDIPAKLEKKELLEKLEPTLDSLQKLGLL